MPKDNVDVIQGAWDAFGKGDVEAATAIAADDGEIVIPESVPWGGTYRGQDGFKQFLARLLDHFDEFHAVPQKVLGADDDHVIVVARNTARTKSGNRLENDAIWLYQLRDGKVRSAMALTDTAKVLEALD